MVPEWTGGQWNDALGAGVTRVAGGTDAMKSRSKEQVPAPPGMPLAWVPEMEGPFFSWTPGPSVAFNHDWLIDSRGDSAG